MSIRHPLCFSLLATSLVAACGGEFAVVPAVEDGTIEDGTRERQDIVRCPDPESECTSTNGKGIYYVEGGHAYVDNTRRMLITRFINSTAPTDTNVYVTFAGRWYDAASSIWAALPVPGHVKSADLNGKSWDVRSFDVRTDGFAVTLYNPIDGQRVFSGSSLVGLMLHIKAWHVSSTGPAQLYVVGFQSIVPESKLFGYRLLWRVDAAGSAWAPYCRDAASAIDSAVFHKGIIVDALNGQVTYNSASVTMACRLGAPPVCQSWDFDPMAASWYFRSCIQMKRASYCGNQDGWTKQGTEIQIQTPQLQNPIDQLEAYWTPSGAACVSTQRHPELGWNKTCNGVPVPSCLGYSPSDLDWLRSGVPFPAM